MDKLNSRKPRGKVKAAVEEKTSPDGKHLKHIVFDEENDRKSPLGSNAESSRKNKLNFPQVKTPKRSKSTDPPKQEKKSKLSNKRALHNKGGDVYNSLPSLDLPPTSKRPTPIGSRAIDKGGDKKLKASAAPIPPIKKGAKTLPGLSPRDDFERKEFQQRENRSQQSKTESKPVPKVFELQPKTTAGAPKVNATGTGHKGDSSRGGGYQGGPPNPGKDTMGLIIDDFLARTKGDMTAQAGELVTIIEKGDPDWWMVKQRYGSRQGFVPSNYVALEGRLDVFPWYGGDMTLRDSERLLLRPRLVDGTFLIRKTDKDHFMLSVRFNISEAQGTVKHYKIRTAGGVYYLTLQRGFQDLPTLVRHYAEDSGILCCKLVEPCPMPPPVLFDLSRDTKKDWELDRKTLAFEDEVGQGHFGTVFKGLWNNTVDVAIKTLRPGTMSAQSFMSEAHIMRNLKHVNLVRLYAVCSQEEPIYIITEYLSKGSLVKFLKGREGRLLKLPSLVDLAAQVASGMAYLESKRFIHRDLAARNILIGDGNLAKVADFGLAKVIEGYDYKNQNINMFGNIFPIKWTAPEAAFMGRFSIKSDVWSYGILLMEVVTYGEIPYPGIRSDQILKKVQKGYRMEMPRHCSQPMYSIMRQCWDEKPSKRPTFKYLYNFFDTYYYALKKDNYPI